LPQIGAAAANEIAQAARRAEQAGYESIWVSDHLIVPESGGRLPPIEILEPIATLAYAAAVTSRIKLATSVIVVPYRNAIHLAKELATLDRLSSGRVVAGVASRWLEAEFRALGVSFEKRGAYTDEAIALMRAAWSSAVPEFHGEFFKLAGMRFGPRPAAGNIPIWVGGTSRRAVRRAVELGDGWHGTRMNPDQVAERIGWIREIAARRGRSLDDFAISHRVYFGFAPKWTDTGGYVDGILAPRRNRRLPESLCRNRRPGNPDKPTRQRPSRKISRPASTPKSAPSSRNLPVVRALCRLVSLSLAM